MTQNAFLFRWATNCVVMLLLSACAFNQITPTLQPTNTFTPSPTVQPTFASTPTFTPTRVQTPTPTPISFVSDAYKGWLTYTNAKYKFSLRYPSDWTSREIQGAINTMSGHAVYIEPPASSLVRLVVGFKRATEDQQITRTGVGSGDIVQRGLIVFLGQPIRRDILVLNGKDLAILYQGSGEIRRGDLIFTLSLDYRGNPTDKLTLTPEIETIADKIVASFELVR
jgi:hypothetical protein